MTNFDLHQRLAQDSFFVTEFNLCQIRLINTQDYIWFILVPKINNVTHLTDLSNVQQISLFQEINIVAEIITKIYTPERLNIASIGNVVAQMHWHIIVRSSGDKAWPGPVWGTELMLYEKGQEKEVISKFLDALKDYENA